MSGSLLLGHFHLHWEGDPPSPERDEFLLDLRSASDAASFGHDAAGMLALQALNPMATLPASQRARLSLLVTGPSATLPFLCACVLGFQRVAAVVSEAEQVALQGLIPSDFSGQAECLDRAERLPQDRAFHRVLLGCDGAVPEVITGAPLVQRLRPEGQFILFGLPQTSAQDTFVRFSENGLSLRGAGFRENLAFLAGSLGGSLGG